MTEFINDDEPDHAPEPPQAEDTPATRQASESLEAPKNTQHLIQNLVHMALKDLDVEGKTDFIFRLGWMLVLMLSIMAGSMLIFALAVDGSIGPWSIGLGVAGALAALLLRRRGKGPGKR